MGEATEVALRVLAEKIGLGAAGAAPDPQLTRAERAAFCNTFWQHRIQKVFWLAWASSGVLDGF